MIITSWIGMVEMVIDDNIDVSRSALSVHHNLFGVILTRQELISSLSQAIKQEVSTDGR
jgi:hypothetical protein